MEIIKKYPKVAKQFEKMYETRCNEILTEMLETDYEYKKLCKKRTDSSMELKNAIVGSKIDILFEKYSDSAYTQDAYELDAIYKKAIEDAINILEENCLI